MINSTIDHNTANIGGGIYHDGGVVVLVKSAISGNTANFEGGGIYHESGNVEPNHQPPYGQHRP